MSRLKKFLEQDNNAEAEDAADDGFEEGKGGMTSRDFEHNHRYTVNDDGNGETTEDGEDKHSHAIKDFEVQQAGEHNHTLKMEEAKTSKKEQGKLKKKMSKAYSFHNDQAISKKKKGCS